MPDAVIPLLASANVDNTIVPAPEPTPMPTPAPGGFTLFAPAIEVLGKLGIGGVFAVALLYMIQAWMVNSRQDWHDAQAQTATQMKMLTDSIDKNTAATNALQQEIRRTTKKE